MSEFKRLKVDRTKIEGELAGIEQRLASTSLDRKERAKLQKSASRLQKVLFAIDRLSEAREEVDALREMISSDGELAEMAREELPAAEEKERMLQRELEELLMPSSESDDRPIFLEIRAGAGGQEAALFAADLVKMYTAFAEKMGWRVSVVDADRTDLGGFKEIVLNIRGSGVYRWMKFESGVHRVQRVPKTESAGRIHTSTVTVVVLPEVEDVEVEIRPDEIKVDTFRAGGAGGQHVNKTDSAVRITHIPTGIVVSCQDERSQIKNKEKAMKILRARLYEMERRKQEQELSESRKKQIGTGERSEKIRTYNFPQNRVTDHRIGLTLKNLDQVLAGALEKVVKPLLEAEAEKRAELLQEMLGAESP